MCSEFDLRTEVPPRHGCCVLLDARSRAYNPFRAIVPGFSSRSSSLPNRFTESSMLDHARLHRV